MVIATSIAIASWMTSVHPILRGMRSVAPEQRAALLSRTVEDLRRFCGAGHAAALDEHCRDLAYFAAQFDECRGDCEALVRPFITPRPTR